MPAVLHHEKESICFGHLPSSTSRSLQSQAHLDSTCSRLLYFPVTQCPLSPSFKQNCSLHTLLETTNLRLILLVKQTQSGHIFGVALSGHKKNLWALFLIVSLLPLININQLTIDQLETTSLPGQSLGAQMPAIIMSWVPANHFIDR